MKYVRPKKKLGQHFLRDQQIALDIVDAIPGPEEINNIIEIGPGTGVLSGPLIKKGYSRLILLDIDRESIQYLKQTFPSVSTSIVLGDFLKMDIADWFGEQHYSIIGNFPYNISSQIFFKVLNEKERVDHVVCMIQKEVADRICAKHGSKTYGILSVLLQAFYDIEFLFKVEPHVFEPPPKVMSAVIRLKRNKVTDLGCDEIQFKRVVKEGFQKRRKTLRNALKGLNLSDNLLQSEILNKRAEQLSVNDFIDLTNRISDS